MLIRNEHQEDQDAITAIHYAAFMNHPQHAPGAEPVEHEIVNRLRRAGDLTLSLVAEMDGAIVGHAAVSPAAIGAMGPGWYGLGPIGTRPGRQGRGVGSALMREAVSRLRGLGAKGIVLVGEPGFYGRFGFSSREGLSCMGIPTRYVLALTFGEDAPEGEIAFHEAFGCGGEAPRP